jgi:hypothetical protein
MRSLLFVMRSAVAPIAALTVNESFFSSNTSSELRSACINSAETRVKCAQKSSVSRLCRLALNFSTASASQARRLTSSRSRSISSGAATVLQNRAMRRFKSSVSSSADDERALHLFADRDGKKRDRPRLFRRRAAALAQIERDFLFERVEQQFIVRRQVDPELLTFERAGREQTFESIRRAVRATRAKIKRTAATKI